MGSISSREHEMEILENIGYELNINQQHEMEIRNSNNWNFYFQLQELKNLTYFQLRESPYPINIPTPTPAPAPSWGTRGNLGNHLSANSLLKSAN